MLGDEVIELRNRLARPPTGKLGVDESLLGDEPEFREALRFGLRPFLVVELDVGVTAPNGQRRPERGGSRPASPAAR